MARILLVCSTVDGHTLEICERLRDLVQKAGHEASVEMLTSESEPETGSFDSVVIGASIRYGKHRPAVAAFINKHLKLLEATPSAFFSVNAVARKPDKKDPETNPYVRKFLQNIAWRPRLIGIFGGQINYPSYGFFDKTMIRFIMWMTKGPTDPNGKFDFTDWDDVAAFAKKLISLQD